jgi:hypothetical protein
MKHTPCRFRTQLYSDLTPGDDALKVGTQATAQHSGIPGGSRAPCRAHCLHSPPGVRPTCVYIPYGSSAPCRALCFPSFPDLTSIPLVDASIHLCDTIYLHTWGQQHSMSRHGRGDLHGRVWSGHTSRSRTQLLPGQPQAIHLKPQVSVACLLVYVVFHCCLAQTHDTHTRGISSLHRIYAGPLCCCNHTFPARHNLISCGDSVIYVYTYIHVRAL